MDLSASDNSLLDKYQRACYQYKLEIRTGGCRRDSGARDCQSHRVVRGRQLIFSRLRVLQSNGRLETDLLERLEDSLQQKSASVPEENVPNTSSRIHEQKIPLPPLAKSAPRQSLRLLALAFRT